MSAQPAPADDASSRAIARVVDLRRLVRTDVVLEAAFAHVRRSPASIFHILGWAVRGKATLGEKVAQAGAFDAAALPYDAELVERLRAAQEAGTRVLLSADAPRPLTEAVAGHLGIFAAAAPTADIARDHPSAQREPDAPQKGRARALLRALRPHQWTKNLLLFIPALLGHAVFRPEVLAQAALAFAAFSLCASSVYVLNDLLDLHADRAHHSKRRRPFASGDLPLGWGLVLAPVLLLAAFLIALTLPPVFLAVLATYYAVTLAYSLYIKRIVLVDVLVLAGLYTVRIIAGSAAYQVPTSQWLLGFSLFLFLSLAFVKRYSEALALRQKGREEALGRGYRASDLEQLSSLGAAAGYISALVLVLYVNSGDVSRLYAHPERLWGLLPLVLYWVSRMWLLAHRGQMHDDPIVFAIRDRVSYLLALLAGACVFLAI